MGRSAAPITSPSPFLKGCALRHGVWVESELTAGPGQLWSLTSLCSVLCSWDSGAGSRISFFLQILWSPLLSQLSSSPAFFFSLSYIWTWRVTQNPSGCSLRLQPPAVSPGRSPSAVESCLSLSLTRPSTLLQSGQQSDNWFSDGPWDGCSF